MIQGVNILHQLDLLHGLIDLLEYKARYQLESSGRKPQDLHLLERLEQSGSMPTLEISRRYGISPATVIAMLDRLQADGLVERQRSSEDKRVVEVSLTADGRRLVAQHMAEDRAFAENLFASLEPTESSLLQELLARLLTAVNKENLFTTE